MVLAALPLRLLYKLPLNARVPVGVAATIVGAVVLEWVSSPTPSECRRRAPPRSSAPTEGALRRRIIRSQRRGCIGVISPRPFADRARLSSLLLTSVAEERLRTLTPEWKAATEARRRELNQDPFFRKFNKQG
jgi:hypothetical protein